MPTINAWNNDIEAAGSTLNGGAVNIGSDAVDNTINIGTAANVGRLINIGNAVGTSGGPNTIVTLEGGQGAGVIVGDTHFPNYGITLQAGGDNIIAFTPVGGPFGTTYETFLINGSSSTPNRLYIGGAGNTWTLSVDEVGQVTNIGQPCFSAYSSSGTLPAITGDGTVAQVTLDATLINQDSVYDTTSYVFTAPVTGNYLLMFWAQAENIDVTNTQQYVYIVTSARTYYQAYMSPFPITANNNLQLCAQVIAPMTAVDTAYIEYRVDGGATTNVGLNAGAGYAGFSGYLLC